MRQEREKVTENGSGNQSGGGSINTSQSKKNNWKLYAVIAIVAAVLVYLIAS